MQYHIFVPPLGENGRNINVSRANKHSNELHTAVSAAFSYFLQCRVKTGGKLLLFIILQRIQQKSGGAKGYTNRKLDSRDACKV